MHALSITTDAPLPLPFQGNRNVTVESVLINGERKENFVVFVRLNFFRSSSFFLFCSAEKEVLRKVL